MCGERPKVLAGESCWAADGTYINSENATLCLNGLNKKQGIAKVIEWLEANKIGKATVNYKLRDWLFSRQRYWGEPFPIIYWEDGEISTVDDAELPVLLHPFAPHIAEEMWSILGHNEFLTNVAWPEADASKAVENTVEVVFQVNGKLRAKASVSKDMDKAALEKLAMDNERMKEFRTWSSVLNQSCGFLVENCIEFPNFEGMRKNKPLAWFLTSSDKIGIYIANMNTAQNNTMYRSQSRNFCGFDAFRNRIISQLALLGTELSDDETGVLLNFYRQGESETYVLAALGY